MLLLIYPITPLNGAPRVTVHAPLSGYRCMHRYAGHLFRKISNVIVKVSYANDGQKIHFFTKNVCVLSICCLFLTLFDHLNHS